MFVASAPSFWERGSDSASNLLSITQAQRAVLRPFTKVSSSPSYGFFPPTVCLYVARKPQQPEVSQVTVKVRSFIQDTWPNSKFTGSEADRSGGIMFNSLHPHGLQHTSFPVLHYLPEFAQTHVRWVSDANQPSHPLSPPSPPAFNLSQNQDLFQWVSPLHQVAKVLELQL